MRGHLRLLSARTWPRPAGDPVDDLDLLHDPEDPGGPRRPPWMLLGGIVAVALLALVGVVWMVGTVVDGGDRPPAAASTGPTSTSGSAAPTATPSTPTAT